jgi:hypothetical protein
MESQYQIALTLRFFNYPQTLNQCKDSHYYQLELYQDLLEGMHSDLNFKNTGHRLAIKIFFFMEFQAYAL